jgi:AraC-like DNA-binding protein
MAHSRIGTFADADHYQEAVRASRTELFVTAAGAFHGEVTAIDLQRLWLQRGADNLARLARLSVKPDRAPISFHADVDQAPIQHAGGEVTPGEILVHAADAVHIQRTRGAYRWSSMSLTPEDLARAGETIAGRPLTVPADTFAFRPPPALMARLMALHQAATQLAKQQPERLADAATARALEQDLLHAMVACLSSREAVGTRRFWQHAKVIVRFEDFLASKRYEPVYIAEICSAIGVSERTLRTCCHEHFGMGPVRYLWLRRMHLAKRALLRADAASATVTTIATEHGFWELGRFSVEYRGLFGEPPSATLKRPPDDALGAKAH